MEVEKEKHFNAQLVAQGPEEMCLSLEHQNPSQTSEKMGYFDRVDSRSRYSSLLIL